MTAQIEAGKKRVLEVRFGPFTIFAVVFFLTIACFVFFVVCVAHETAYDKLQCLIFGIPAIVIIATRFRRSSLIYKVLFGMCLAINCFFIYAAIWGAVKAGLR